MGQARSRETNELVVTVDAFTLPSRPSLMSAFPFLEEHGNVLRRCDRVRRAPQR